jgi:hypothetical protein
LFRVTLHWGGGGDSSSYDSGVQTPRWNAYSPFVSEVTQILERVEHGDPNAADQLLPLVYEELRKLAAARMA